MAKYEARIQGDFNETAELLHQAVMNSALSMKLVDESYMTEGTVQVLSRVYDKYFMRNSSRASLSIMLAGQGQNLMISAIGAGGGNGALFNFSWGAEEDMVAVVEDFVAQQRSC